MRSVGRVPAMHYGHHRRRDALRPLTTTDRRRRRAATKSAQPPSVRRVAWLSRARSALWLPLPAGSWLWYSRESDNLATRNRIASTASAGPCRRTWGILAGLIGDELVEIRIGEHAALAALAVADGDIFERARLHVAVERLHRAMKLACGLGGGAPGLRPPG